MRQLSLLLLHSYTAMYGHVLFLEHNNNNIINRKIFVDVLKCFQYKKEPCFDALDHSLLLRIGPGLFCQRRDELVDQPTNNIIRTVYFQCSCSL